MPRQLFYCEAVSADLRGEERGHAPPNLVLNQFQERPSSASRTQGNLLAPAGASSRTPLRELTALPRHRSWWGWVGRLAAPFPRTPSLLSALWASVFGPSASLLTRNRRLHHHHHHHGRVAVASLHHHIHGRQHASRGLQWDGWNRFVAGRGTCSVDDQVGDAMCGQEVG